MASTPMAVSPTGHPQLAAPAVAVLVVAPTGILAAATTTVVDVVAAAASLKVRTTAARGAPHAHPCGTLGPAQYICGLVKVRRLPFLAFLAHGPDSIRNILRMLWQPCKCRRSSHRGIRHMQRGLQ